MSVASFTVDPLEDRQLFVAAGTPQVTIEARFLQVQDTFTRALGVDFNRLNNGSIVVGDRTLGKAFIINDLGSPIHDTITLPSATNRQGGGQVTDVVSNTNPDAFKILVDGVRTPANALFC